MRPGDRVIAIDGRQIERFEQVSQAIFYRPDENADFTIKRGSETVHLSIKIGTRKEADRFGNEYRIGLIGIQSPPPELRDVSLLEAPGVAVERTGTVLRMLVRSEERRVGKEGVRTCRSRWSPYHYKKKNNKN